MQWTIQRRMMTARKGSEAQSPWYDDIDIDFAGLRSENPDVVGWIYFENEDISYPVMYSGDNSYYLRKTFKREHATAGSIFLEGSNKTDFSDCHTNHLWTQYEKPVYVWKA